MSGLTAERLRAVLHYDAETGVFTSKKRRGTAGGNALGCKSEKGYIKIYVDRRYYFAHRLAFLYVTGAWPAQQVDHINGVRDNNQWANLRPATQAQNQRNKRMAANKKIPLKGVAWNARDKRFYAVIRVDGKYRYGPHRRSAEQAHADYVAFAEEHFGEFARAA